MIELQTGKITFPELNITVSPLLHYADFISDFPKDKITQIRDMMLDKIFENIHSVSYSKDIEHLRADVNRTKNEYNKLSNALNQLRQKLIRLRNEKADLEYHLHALT